jgi:hypothetical protein
MRVHLELVCGLALLLVTAPAPAAGERHDLDRRNILRVPQRYTTIQAAVDAADDGDQIVAGECPTPISPRWARASSPGRPTT